MTMKGSVRLLSCIVLALAIAGQAPAQRQTTSTGTNYGSGAMKVAPIDKDSWVATLDQLGVRVDERGKGPFHLLSTDLQIVMFQDRSGLHYRGYETCVDADGDKVLWEVWDAAGKGNGKVVAGTGKFEGMEGTMEFVLQPPPKPFPEGTIRSVCRETIKAVLRAK
jgi:hypothetical protein